MIEPILLTATQILTYEQGKLLTNASGFFFERDGRLFLVTSRHVVQDEPSQHNPDRIEIQFHVDLDNAADIINFSIPLFQNGQAVWRQGIDNAGEIDVAITATPLKETGLEEIPLYDEPFRVAFPEGHPLDTGGDIDVTTLNREELLLLKDGHCLSDQVARLCGLERKTNVRGLDTQASSLETIVGLVAAGAGITFLPASMLGDAKAPRPGIAIRKATNKAAERRVRMIYRATFPKRALLAAMSAVIAEHLPAGVRPI